MMPIASTSMTVQHLSEHTLEQVRREHPVIVQRVLELREQAQRMHALSDRVDEELEEATRTLRGVEEMLGAAPQLSIDAFSGELRGRRLREIALEILRQRRSPARSCTIAIGTSWLSASEYVLRARIRWRRS